MPLPPGIDPIVRPLHPEHPFARKHLSIPRFRAATFWRRAAGFTVDVLLLAPVALLLGGGAAAIGGDRVPMLSELGFDLLVDIATNGGAIGPMAIGLASIIVALYFFLFTALRGQTLGMRVVGIRIIDEFGAQPSLTRAIARTFGYALSLLLFSLGFLWIAFDRERRGLHDWMARTYVVVDAPVVTPVVAAA